MKVYSLRQKVRDFFFTKYNKAITILFSFLGIYPKTHLYALCWNDEKMLPYFFNHYDKIVDQYFIYDNGSTDSSITLLKSNKKVTLGVFEVKGDSFVKAAADFYNTCWKKSSGVADWVIICNIDEFLFHPMGTKKYLTQQGIQGATIIKPEGYEMISETFPRDYKKQIYEQIKEGSKSNFFNKPQFFNPNKIDEINFELGRHSASPVGIVQYANTIDCKLLHYKYIGVDYWIPRQNELGTGLRTADIKNEWGVQYKWEDEKKIIQFNTLKKSAIKIV